MSNFDWQTRLPAQHRIDVTSMLDTSAAQVWLVWLGADTDAGKDRMLCPDEAARATRFVFDKDRHRYIACRTHLRQLLAMHGGISPENTSFVYSPLGKPSLPGASLPHFNISHSGDVGMIALSAQGPVGVDIELVRPMPESALLAAEHFTSREQAAFSLCAPLVRDHAFMTGWTRKEACLKAVGCGLEVAPRSIDTGIEHSRRQLAVSWQDRVIGIELHSAAIGSDLVCAIAHDVSVSFTAPAVALVRGASSQS
jgi:4'-phosphopantetheinyl transferase